MVSFSSIGGRPASTETASYTPCFPELFAVHAMFSSLENMQVLAHQDR